MKMIIKRGGNIENIVSVERTKTGIRSNRIFSIDDVKRRNPCYQKSDEQKQQDDNTISVTTASISYNGFIPRDTKDMYSSEAANASENSEEDIDTAIRRLPNGVIAVYDKEEDAINIECNPINSDQDSVLENEDLENSDSEDEDIKIESEEIDNQTPGYTVDSNYSREAEREDR